VENALKDFNRLFSEEVVAYKAKVKAAELSLFPPNEPLNTG
jgi:hypothetical protein